LSCTWNFLWSAYRWKHLIFTFTRSTVGDFT
jgi:hypothetical protein